MENIRVGISIGDINGIGPEVIIKALSHSILIKNFTPIIYSSSKIISYYKNVVNADQFSYINCSDPEKAEMGKVNIVNCWNDTVHVNAGTQEVDGGKYAYISLDRATKDLIENKIDALVTAPINKKTMQLAGFPEPGHTEYITKAAGREDSLMFMISDVMKLGLVTAHIPLSEVSEKLSAELVEKKLNMLHHSLKSDFGITKPMIAVLGLNPHAGDDGLIGEEDQSIIKPVIMNNKKKGMLVFGPFSADGFFGSGQFKKYDGILSMYHDQGLVGFKSLSFGKGINFTAGLPIIRTSPDHGTGYDIAGQGIADDTSFRNALILAVDIARYRKEFKELEANSLKKQQKPAEEEN